MNELSPSAREDVERVVNRRREIKRAIRSLEIELSGMPTNAELIAKYGHAVCAFGIYPEGDSDE